MGDHTAAVEYAHYGEPAKMNPLPMPPRTHGFSRNVYAPHSRALPCPVPSTVTTTGGLENQVVDGLSINCMGAQKDTGVFGSGIHLWFRHRIHARKGYLREC